MKSSFSELLSTFIELGVVANNKPTNRAVKILNSNPTQLARLQDLTSFLEIDLTTIQKIHLIINGITIQPKCFVCNKAVGMYSNTTNVGKFKKYCSSKCNNQCKSKQEKSKQTMIKNHGVEFASQSPNIRKKIVNTLMTNYGVDVPIKHPNIRQKINQTCQQRYGTDFPLQSDEIYNKSMQTNIANHDGQHSFYDDSVIEKSQQTLFDKYGVHHSGHIGIDHNTIDNLNREDWLIDQHHTQEKSATTIAKQFGVSTNTVLRKLREKSVKNKLFSTSQGEKEVFLCVKSLLPTANIIQRDRTLLHPQEIDIFIPEYMLAIEYNGTYRHSESCGKDQEYHYLKTLTCNEKNVQLLHIWEHDWANDRHLVEMIIKEYLKIIPERIPNLHHSVDGMVYVQNRDYPYKHFLKDDGFIITQIIPPQRKQFQHHYYWNCGFEIWLKN